MTNLTSGRIDLVSPCHSAPLVITTAIEGHGHLSRDVPDEILCAADRCLNSWDRAGVASEWNTRAGDGHAEASAIADSVSDSAKAGR